MEDDADASIGGILGTTYDSWTSSYKVATIITNCVNSGDIGENYYNDDSEVSIGGITGRIDSNGSDDYTHQIINCVNRGKMTCAATDGYVGGIVGYLYHPLSSYCSSIEMCINQSDVELVNSDDLSAWGICGSGGGSYSHVFNLNSTLSKLTPDLLQVKDGGSTGYDSGTWDIQLFELQILIRKFYSDSSWDFATWKREYSSDGSGRFDLEF